MNLLALDTATEACSVALQVGTDTLARFEVAGRSHTEKLVPMVQALLAEAGIGYAQLDGYVCGVGPGSFAGVRIGVSFIKGLALAHERPVVGVSSLAMLAQRGIDTGATQVLAAIDARMDEVYFAAYTRSVDGLASLQDEEIVCAPAQIGVHAGRWAALGSGWRYRDAMQLASGATLDAVDVAALPHAEDGLRLAAAGFREGRTIGAAQLVPRYLRNKVALTLVEQRAARGA